MRIRSHLAMAFLFLGGVNFSLVAQTTASKETSDASAFRKSLQAKLAAGKTDEATAFFKETFKAATTAQAKKRLREDYLRATLLLDEAGGLPEVSPLALQDSSLVSVLQQADCLVIRPPFALAVQRGDLCRIIELKQSGF